MYCLYRKSLFYHVKKGYFFIAAFLLIFFFFFLYLNSLNQISFCTSPLNFQFKVPVFMFQMLLGPCSNSFCAYWHSAFPGSDVDLKCFSKTFNIIASSPFDHDFFCTEFCFEARSFVPINSMKSTYFKVTIKGAFPHF